MMSVVLIVWIIGAYLLMSRYLSSRPLLFRLILAYFFSFAVLSISFAFSLFLHIPFTALCVGLIVPPLVYSVMHLRKLPKEKWKLPEISFGSTALMVLVFLILFVILFFGTVQRWGQWDSWAIWCLHARFLLDEVYFSNLFTNTIAWTHPDYPLLLPSAIAMLWKGSGHAGPTVPMVLALITAVSIPLLLFTVLNTNTSRKTSVFIFAALTLGGVLFPFVNAQYADSLLAVFFLIALIFLNTPKQDASSFTVFLGGFFSACCCLIKNEGFPFFLMLSLVVLFRNIKDFRHLLRYGLGALFPFALSAYFKMTYAPPSDLFMENKDILLSKLSDPARHSVILEYFYTFLTTSNNYTLILLFFALVFVPEWFVSQNALIIFFTILSYYLIYTITPMDLSLHLSSSFDRLMHQIFPALLYTVLASYSERQKRMEAVS